MEKLNWLKAKREQIESIKQLRKVVESARSIIDESTRIETSLIHH